MLRALRRLGGSVLVLAIAAGALFLWRAASPGKEAKLWPKRVPRPYVMFGEPADPRWPPGPKKPGEYRVVMLGGSTVAEGDPTLPELLEKIFARKGFKGVSVYNLGVVSQKSGQELARLVFEAVDAEPDLVLVYDGGNDVMDPLYLDPRPGYPMDFLMYENNPLFANPESYPALLLLFYRSGWARRHFRQFFADHLLYMTALQQRAGFNTDAWRQQIADVYVGNMVKSRAIAHAFGAKFVVVFQPLVYYKKPAAPEEKEILTPRASMHAVDVRQKIWRAFALARKKTPLKVVDLSAFFDGTQKDVFTDYIHIQQEFQAPLAEEIYRVLDVKNAGGKPSVKD